MYPNKTFNIKYQNKNLSFQISLQGKSSFKNYAFMTLVYEMYENKACCSLRLPESQSQSVK